MKTKQKQTVNEKFPSTKKHYDALEKYNDLVISTSFRMLKGNNYPIFVPDMLIIGIAKRCIDLNDAISILSNKWNFVASAPLLRIQLDNLLKLVYLKSTNFSDVFCKEVIEGKSFLDLKDVDGKKLSDARLRDYARKEYPWIDGLYKELSKHVHFSDKHMFLTINSVGEDRTSTFFIGKGNETWPEEEVNAFLSAAARIMQEILAIVEVWVAFKETRVKTGKYAR